MSYDRAERESKQADNSKFKVLIADDEAAIRTTLAETVRAWGYRTVEAATLAETFAIVDSHQAVVDADRGERLKEVVDPTVRDCVSLFLAPLAEQLRSPSGRDYLRIVPQILDLDDLAPPALGRTIELLSDLLDLPEDRRGVRLRSMILAASALLADRAGQKRPVLPHDRFVENLVDMATGMLLAPT